MGRNRKKIILFGSYAKLDYEKESDIDIIILTNLSNSDIDNFNEKINAISTDLSLKHNVVLSIILKDTKQFYKYVDVLPFYNSIVTQGITLYG